MKGQCRISLYLYIVTTLELFQINILFYIVFLLFYESKVLLFINSVISISMSQNFSCIFTIYLFIENFIYKYFVNIIPLSFPVILMSCSGNCIVEISQVQIPCHTIHRRHYLLADKYTV